MATRSNIGAKQADGTIKAIYCHWDGYPAHVGATLSEHYNTAEKVEALLNLGDISTLEQTIEDTQANAYSMRGDHDTKARTFTSEAEWREYAVAQWAEYIYLFEGEWNYKEVTDYWKALPKYAEELTSA